MSPPETPQQIGRYRILQPLGEGGMGTVYLAEDPRIGRRLAIKTVRVSSSTRDVEENQQRLLMEARAAGRLLHPNVVTLFDADEVDGLLFLAFEYVPGADLSRRLSSQPPLTLRQVLHLLREIASALDQAHQAGIVHRDIKPSNVLISPEGTAKVADFGLAKLKNESLELTRTGSVLGSPQYMSPEQVRGEALDGRSDLFSLGVLAYEMLSSIRPFGGETISTLVFEILGKDPMALDHLRPGLPPRLVHLVHGMLAKELVSRLPSAAMVIAELDAVLRATPQAVLDAPAVPPLDDAAPTRLMASSAAPSPPPLPHLPTATLQAPPPPPPSGPPSRPSHAGPAPTPAHPATLHSTTGFPQAAQTSAGRKTSLAGVLAMAVLVVGLVGALGGGGWWLMHSFAAHRTDSPATAQEQSPDTPDPAADLPLPPADEANRHGTEPPTAESTPQVAEPPTAGKPVATTSPPPPPRIETKPSSQVASRSEASPTLQTPPPPPPPITSSPPKASTPPPTTTRPSTPPANPTPTARQEAVVPRTPPPPTVAEHLLTFDQLASSAQRQIDCGRLLTFDVEPEDALIRVWRRGEERQRVMGQAQTYAHKNKGTNALELPEAGQYLITLVAEGFPDFVIYAVATAGRGPTPQPIQVALQVASTRSGVERIQVSRGLAFNGSPQDAEVFVNGARQGPAARWPGGGRPGGVRNLQLAPGLHKIRIEAPGVRPYEFEVEVTPTARRRVQTIDYALRR